MSSTVSYLDYEDVPVFSERDRAFAQMHPQLHQLLPYPTTLQGLEQAIQDRDKYEVKRKLLAEVLRVQYADLDNTSSQLDAISQLEAEGSYTVITAHQPSLALGPLYYVYKILSAIKLARNLQESSGKPIVPVFVIGGEDHDFEEIQTVHLFSKSVTWRPDEYGGPVGRMSTQGLAAVKSQLSEILGDKENDQRLLEILSAWERHDTYGAAVHEIVHELFATYGLLILRMDDARLKRAFLPIMWKELTERPSHDLVRAAQETIKAAGFTDQAYPREINLFYLQDGRRDRIEYDDGRYTVVDTKIVWSEAELQSELEAHPEAFSPNVVMRPLYQESILPNVAYVGGGGELAYWNERWEQFKHYDVFFPVLVRRDSFLQITARAADDLESLGLSVPELYGDIDNVIASFIEKDKPEAYELPGTQEQMAHIYDDIIERIAKVDPSLSKSVAADKAKAVKSIENLQKKLNRSYKNQQEVKVRKIQKVRDLIYPEQKLQERHESFISYYLRYGNDFFDQMLHYADPLDMRMKVVRWS